MAIFMALSTVGFLAVIGNLAKGRDAKRKSDLARMKTAMEDYFGDNACYPENTALSVCGGESLAPYLNHVPCDPLTKLAYVFQVGGDSPGCNNWFKIYTFLENIDDPAIARFGLGNGETVSGEEVNYGVSSDNVSVGEII